MDGLNEFGYEASPIHGQSAHILFFFFSEKNNKIMMVEINKQKKEVKK